MVPGISNGNESQSKAFEEIIQTASRPSYLMNIPVHSYFTRWGITTICYDSMNF